MPAVLQSPSFSLEWEPKEGLIRLKSPGRCLEIVPGVEVVEGGRVRTLTVSAAIPGRVNQATIRDAHGWAEEMQISFQESGGLALSLRLRLYTGRPFVLFQIAVTHVGTEPVRLRRFFARGAPGGLSMTAEPTGFFVNGWQSWSYAGYVPMNQRGFRPSLPLRWLQGPSIHNTQTPWNRAPNRWWSESVGALVTSREALVMGAVSLADQFVQVGADCRSERSERRKIALQSQLDDIPLTAGAAHVSEWFYLEWVPLPNPDPFAQFAHAVMRQMSLDKPRPAPTGWCSWYVYWDKVSEGDVMENLASAALLAETLPLHVIQLDDGFQETWGDWDACNERFPRGLAWLAQRIEGSGFTPGLWLAPFLAHPRSALLQEHPDWVLKEDRIRAAPTGLVSTFLGRALDTTHPGVLEHIHDLVKRAVHEWGFQYLKLDFLYAGALAGRRHNPQLTRAQALRAALQTIRKAAGPEVYLLGCGAPLGPCVGAVDAMRVGPDTAPSWTPVFRRVRRPLRGNPCAPSLRNSLRNVMARAWMHNRWWTNDPDVLLLRDVQGELTPSEVMAQLTLIGLSNGLFMLSDDLDDLPPERRSLAAKLLPSLLDGADVLDLFSSAMPEEVLVPVARPWGRWRLIGLFNWTDSPVERLLPDSITLDARRAYHLVDFWEQRYVAITPGALPPVMHLDPHGAVLLGLRSVRPNAHVVSTSFHISQGGEISQFSVDPGRMDLTLELGRQERGEIWLSLPKRPREVLANDESLSRDAVRAVAMQVWAIELQVRHSTRLRVLWEPEEA